MLIIEKWIDCWKISLTTLLLIALACLSASKTFALDIAAIEKALDGKRTANFMDIQFRNPKEKEKVIVIMSSLDSSLIEMMMLFRHDQCEGQAQHQDGTGSFKLSCMDGGKISSSFSCSSSAQCFMRGEHSQRGKFIFNFKHGGKTMSLEDILSFTDLANTTTEQVATSSQTEPTSENEARAVQASTATASLASKSAQDTTIAKAASSTETATSTVTAAATPTPSTSETTTSAVTVATTPTSSTVSVSASSTKWRDAKDANEAQRFADEIQASIVMFMAIADVIKQQPLTMKDRVLSVVDSEIARLQQEKQLLQDQLSSRFSTPIRPNNANLSVSAFRAADTFPKIPFYVPGTNEIGEMLVVPRVTDEGYLNYQFDFLDPTSTYDKVRDSIDVAHGDIGALIFGLNKVDEWTKVAQENNVNRRIEKTASCIPDGMCEEKKQGVSSTEVVFQVYEDGSTAGRIQRNKGKFMVGYNMSVESSILLSAYLIYMRDVGAKEFNIGVMTDDEVKDLFN